MRASNTTPVIVLRFEADTEKKLKEIQAEFKSILEQHISPEKIPFQNTLLIYFNLAATHIQE